MTEKSSIDQRELNKFNKTAEEWWDKNGEFKTLHDINPLRIKYIMDRIDYHLSANENISIIDVGCGGGLISVPLHKLGAKVTGLDANKHNTDAASKYAKKNKLEIEFINGTIEEHKDKYDVVLCLEVIEHVANPAEFVQNLTRLAKDGGMIILSTINRTVKSYLQAIIMGEYVLRWVPIGTHDYAKFIKPSELKNMLKNSKFQIKELKGLKLNPITNSWYLTDDIDVNYFSIIIPTTKTKDLT